MLSVLSHSKMDSNQILITVCGNAASADDCVEVKGATQESYLWVIHRPGTKHVEYRAKGALRKTLMLLAYDYATMLVLEGGEGEDLAFRLLLVHTRWRGECHSVCFRCILVFNDLTCERCACSWECF